MCVAFAAMGFLALLAGCAAIGFLAVLAECAFVGFPVFLVAYAAMGILPAVGGLNRNTDKRSTDMRIWGRRVGQSIDKGG